MGRDAQYINIEWSVVTSIQAFNKEQSGTDTKIKFYKIVAAVFLVHRGYSQKNMKQNSLMRWKFPRGVKDAWKPR